jgi:predicted ATPase/DNA-binding XRE family transcriptional regulator
MDALTEVSFGEWLKRRRKGMGLTQQQLAAQIHCSTVMLKKIEAEERRPSAQIVERLAEIFDIPPNEQTAFLRFVRGDWKSVPNAGIEDMPWQVSPTAPRSNLPASVNSLIGREQDLSDVQKYLEEANTRLITLIGPPGIGKTRLSIESARTALLNFPDGVFFVELAPLDESDLIAITIAQVLGFVEAKNISTNEQLKAVIGAKRILLVLDNCEHLIEDVSLLASDLLLACPRVKILATSRESLRVPGEWLYPVPAFDVSNENSSIDMETAIHVPALALFAERARAVRSSFSLNPDNIQTVITICAHLDGLPLAIELIAARMSVMSPQTLLERLNDQFVLSADGMRAISMRQKTLKNAIGWSYNLLSAEEQMLFVYLSVFSGSFTLKAVEAAFSVLFTSRSISSLVTSLSDKSLLQWTLDTRGETRFHMLVTIQQFASDVLRSSGNEPQAHDLHLAYFLAIAEKGDAEIRGPNQVEWVNRIQSDHNNMRAALDWAVFSGKTELALRLLCALGWFWEIRGHYLEARNWLGKIRTLPDVADYPIPLARTLNHIGRYNWTQDNSQEARILLEESRAISTKLGAKGEKSLAEALNWLGLLEIDHNKEAAKFLLEYSLTLSQQCKDDWAIAVSTFQLGILESKSDHSDLALSLMEEGLEMFRHLGDLFFIARVSSFLGYLFLDHGEYDKARQLFEQHLAIDTELQFWDGIAQGWRDLGHLARRQGDHEQAQSYYDQGQAVAREHGIVLKTMP